MDATKLPLLCNTIGAGVSSAVSTTHGSHPDLSKLGALAAEAQITFRSKPNHKRKQPSDVNNCECSSEVKEIRSELSRIGSLLERYVDSNQQIMIKMQESITEVKSQISELKSSNDQTVQLIRENITQISAVKSTTSNIEMKQNGLNLKVSSLEKQICQGEQKIISLESDLNTLKLSFPSQPTQSKMDNQIFSNEQIIKGLIERNNRGKNVIFSGVPEQTASSKEEKLF